MVARAQKRAAWQGRGARVRWEASSGRTGGSSSRAAGKGRGGTAREGLVFSGGCGREQRAALVEDDGGRGRGRGRGLVGGGR